MACSVYLSSIKTSWNENWSLTRMNHQNIVESLCTRAPPYVLFSRQNMGCAPRYGGYSPKPSNVHRVGKFYDVLMFQLLGLYDVLMADMYLF
jgi:hypothetical protein